jgi:HAD superfamily hydrolase (TIGR01549 family)
MSSPLRPFQAILFDLDGVLVDSHEVWFQLLNQAALHWGYPPISRGAYEAAFGQGVEEDQEHFYPNHSIPEIEAFFDEHFMDHADLLQTSADTPAVFAALEAKEVRTAVITNTPNPLAGQVVKRAGATPETVIGGNDVPRAKPAPDMVLEAVARLGMSREQCLVVGDSRYDAEAARAAGVTFAGFGGIEGDVSLGSLVELLDYV